MFEDLFKGNVGAALVTTVGAAALAPVVGPLLRPLAKNVVKAGLLAFDQGRVLVADLNERTGDIVAEAREEIKQNHPAQEQVSAPAEVVA